MSGPIRAGFALGEPEPAPAIEPDPAPVYNAAVEPDPAELAIAPIVSTPEQLAGQRLIPYESTDRTPAGPLQELETATAAYLGIDPGQLLSREGNILADGGSAALFQLLPWPGAIEPIGWVIASHASGEGDARLRITSRGWEDPARVAYAAAVTRLGGRA